MCWNSPQYRIQTTLHNTKQVLIVGSLVSCQHNATCIKIQRAKNKIIVNREKKDYSQCQIIKCIEKYGISFLSDIHEKSNIKSFTMPHITDCNFIPFIHLSIHLSVRYIASSTLGPVMVVFTTSSRAIMISAPILFCTFYDRNTIAQENWSIRYFKLVI